MFHDYKGRGIYLITICTEGRLPLLGTLAGDSADDAHIVPTVLGQEVLRLWEDIPTFQRRKAEEKHTRRDICILATQLMPDHLHGVLFVRHEMDISLGHIIGGFMMSCTKARAGLTLSGGLTLGVGSTLGVHAESTTAEPQATAGRKAAAPLPPLWERGYHDRRLTREGQLQNMIDYVRDNPRRLWLRRHNREVFAVRRGVEFMGHRFSAVGNMLLLDECLHAVHVRRRFTDAERRQYMNDCILAARQGAVLIGAFISEYEQQVREVALQEGWAVIQLSSEPFSDYYKPSGTLFDACARGQLLMLHEEAEQDSACTPRVQQPQKAQQPPAQTSACTPRVQQPLRGQQQSAFSKRITREQCVALNNLAEALAADSGMAK